MSNYVKTKNVKKASTFVLTTSILMGSVYPAFADTNTSKDEVVYVKLNNNGNVDNVYVVNSFDVKNGEKIVDYGRYSNVLNLSTGKSGNLEISFDIKKNDTVDEVFFNNYALQISLTLDGDKCSDIIADGGTIASVGNNKTITYIKLAGEEASYTINSNAKKWCRYL